jgi:AcrR family transcriptional regulator
MAPPTRSSRRPAAERRGQLLDITSRQLRERGFHGLSIESVAAAAGVTRATVYLHFRDLQELLETLIDRETSRALAQFSETALTPLDEGDPRELMLDALEAFLQAVRSRPATWRLVLTPPEGAPQHLRDRIAAGRVIALQRLAAAVAPLAERDPNLPDPELTARILSAWSDEYARLVLTDPAAYPVSRLIGHARWWLQAGPF